MTTHPPSQKGNNMNATPNTYQTQAQATRRRRQAKGMYEQPTSDQREALRKYMRGCGVEAMTADECVLLACHPNLSRSQHQDWLGRAHKKGWK